MTRASSRVLRTLPDEPRLYRPAAPAVEDGSLSPEERVARAERLGYEAGRERGEQEAARTADQLREELRRTYGASLDRIHTLEASIHREAEAALVRLAVTAASRIVRSRIEEDDQVVVRAVRDTLEEAAGREPRMIRINPADEKAVREAFPALSEPGALRLVTDAAIESGGCLIEAASGQIDARVGSQMGAIAEGLGTEEHP